jgi:hypothetical protein
MVHQVPSRSLVLCSSMKGSSSVVEESLNLNFYTENSTSLIYEVQFFEDFVMARPLSPEFYSAIRQMTWGEFTDEFHEYLGDCYRLRSLIDGEEEKKDVKII